ncbi:DUF1559 domain-containing protein [Rosistilla carotiformis]|nr:DUF1559 domain-containing protein [Rosistilla carotiformis]
MRAKPGFTLVELLVVIAIIGILVGLLLPAVQAAREAARRMSCSNNLKNIGLAMHNYHDTFQGLPPGYINNKATTNGPVSGEYSQWAWGAFILPFIEQAPMHDQLQVGTISLSAALTPGGPSDRTALLATPIDTFICPSDSGPEVHKTDDQLRDSADAWQDVAKSNYIALNTTQRWHSGGRLTGPDTGVTNQWGAGPGNGDKPNGCFMRDRSIRFRDILDGTSNTLLVGERVYQYTNPSGTPTICRAGVAIGNEISNEQLSIRRSLGTLTSAINSTDANTCIHGFAGPHPGGIMFVLGDASVRFISETIDHSPVHNGGTDAVDSTMERLGSREDGQSVGSF